MFNVVLGQDTAKKVSCPEIKLFPTIYTLLVEKNFFSYLSFSFLPAKKAK
jgi:hypothetical protein